MNVHRRKNLVGSSLIAVLCLFAVGIGPSSSAIRKVREGIGHFRSGDYEASAQAFSEADVAEPENETIQFDRACALAASGDAEKAQELFRQTSLSQDALLAAQSHYNLGCLAASTARAILGDDPAATAPQQRPEAISQLMAAVGHYRDCLRIDQDHEDGRYNLELIRLFLKHIQALWEQQDREKSREEMGLLEFLAMIEQRQTEIRTITGALGGEPDSPQRRQAAQETADSQRELYQEIEPLQDKIHEQFQQAAQSQPPGAGSDPNQTSAPSQAEQAEQLLSQLANEAGKLMLQAAAAIDESTFESARITQKDSLDRLNQIFMAAAPFANVLQRATDRQRDLVATSEQILGDTRGDETEESTANSVANTPDDASSDPAASASGQSNSATPDADFPEVGWQQSRVTDWSRMLSLKAEAELPSLEAQQQALAQADESAETTPQPDPDADQTEQQSSQPDPAQQLEALKQSMQKAIELGPQVEEHSSSAVQHIQDESIQDASPDQQAALRLLEEIAEPLSQQDQDQQQQGDDQNEQQQQDQQQQDQQQQDQQQQDQQQQEQQQQQQEEQQNERSPQERAMSALRRARERERQHRDLQKQMQQIIGGRIPVDRDW